MYCIKTYEYGGFREVYRYYPTKRECPREKRGRREKKTGESQQAQNVKNRIRHLRRIIAANFDGGFHLTLSYEKDKRPETMKDAKKELQSFLKEMRKAFQKAGVPFKWIAVTERGAKGACHHHLIVENISTKEMSTVKLVTMLWQNGHRNFVPLYADGEYEGIAEYLQKKETKEENDGCSYSRSRNLIVPKPRIERVPRRQWRDEPRDTAEYELIKSTIVNKVNPYTGTPYQSYMMRRKKNVHERGKRGYKGIGEREGHQRGHGQAQDEGRNDA